MPKSLPDPWAYPDDIVEYVDVGPLLNDLTDAMMSEDRSAFLSHFDGKAHRLASFWWDNLAAIGMDGGAVSTYGDAWNDVPLNSKRRGWLFNVQAGAHFPGDDVDAEGRQVVSTTTYYWKIELPVGQTRPTIVDWISIDRAPWDCICQLTIAKAENAIVATFPDEAELASALIETLDSAASWNLSFFTRAAPHLKPLGGVVAFATNKDERLLEWFQSLFFSQPNFPGGPPAAAVHNLRGYAGHDPRLVSGDDFQGGRIVMGAASSGWEESVLVHELVHYLFTRYDQAPYWLSDNSYVVEGLAEMVQQVFEGTDKESAEQGIWTVGTAAQAWNIYPSLIDSDFQDELPTSAQLQTSDLVLVNFWYDVAASAYSYVAVTYGMEAAIEAGVCAYGGNDLFSCVRDPNAKNPGSGKPGGKGFIDQKTLMADWVTWFHKTYG